MKHNTPSNILDLKWSDHCNIVFTGRPAFSMAHILILCRIISSWYWCFNTDPEVEGTNVIRFVSCLCVPLPFFILSFSWLFQSFGRYMLRSLPWHLTLYVIIGLQWSFENLVPKLLPVPRKLQTEDHHVDMLNNLFPRYVLRIIQYHLLDFLHRNSFLLLPSQCPFDVDYWFGSDVWREKLMEIVGVTQRVQQVQWSLYWN